MIILMIATLVMPILHQPPKAEAAILTTLAVITVIIAGITLLVYIVDVTHDIADDGEAPCDAGCGIDVNPTGQHFTLCINCLGERVWDCVNSKPNGKWVPHRVQCASTVEEGQYISGCWEWYYICTPSGLLDKPPLPSELPEGHRVVPSDCEIHNHRVCRPEHNHLLNKTDCGIHSYPECSPELNHLPANTLCDHNVYTCAVGHEDVFCDLCSFYPACEDHVCPSDDSSGCCDDSSGCCDDGS